MNFIASVFILLGLVGQVRCLSRDQINGIVDSYYSDHGYLDAGVFEITTSYQTRALEATLDALADVGGKNSKHVENYFVAACIYFATNGKSNIATLTDLGGDATPDNWTTEDGWMTGTDYCNWYGIKCHNELIVDQNTRDEQEADERILDINLQNNMITGQWPPEIGILGDHIINIDLRDNQYAECFEYPWFESMNKLQYFFIGGTAWEADGIPVQLRFLTELVQFDASYSHWSEGPMRSSAFAGLDKLEYVKLDNNIYVVDAGQEALEPFTRLPSLIRLYLENIRFEDESGDIVRPSLEFLTECDEIIEAWFDRTLFRGGLPNNLPASLKSLSVSYCGLSGNLTPLVNTAASLNRAWLNHNDFSGPIPDGIATQHNGLKYFYLEGNDFSSQVPQAFCSLLKTNGGTLEGMGAREVECASGCCTCFDSECGNTNDVIPTAAPTAEQPDEQSGGFVVCFSGSSTVEVENVGEIKMEDLAIGDSVRVSNNKFEPIYSFGHKSSSSTAEYLRITTEGSAAALEISPDHMVAMEGGRYVPASLVKKGDRLLTVTDELAAVTSIKNVVRKGAFAPFTASGNIVVNGVVASNYVAYQGSEYVKIGEMETPFSYQFMGHTFNSVHRLAVMVGITGETYTPEGISNWVATAHKMTTYVAGQNALVILGLALLLPLLMFARLIEMLVCSPMATAVVVGGLGFMNYKRSAKKTA